MKPHQKSSVSAGEGFRKVSATLRVWGSELDPAEVSSLFHCEPTAGWKKGDSHPTVKGRVADFGMWSLESQAPPTASFDEHVLWLLSRITADPEAWSGFLRMYEKDVFVGAWINHWNTAFEVSPEVIAELGRRGIPLTFDLYVDKTLQEDE